MSILMLILLLHFFQIIFWKTTWVEGYRKELLYSKKVMIRFVYTPFLTCGLYWVFNIYFSLNNGCLNMMPKFFNFRNGTLVFHRQGHEHGHWLRQVGSLYYLNIWLVLMCISVSQFLPLPLQQSKHVYYFFQVLTSFFL